MAIEHLVEDCFWVTAKQILLNAKLRQDIEHWLENDNDPSIVQVSVGGHEPQRLNLEWETITFGDRAYFRCSCDYRVSKLYLPPNGKQFACRKCHRLQYRLSTINKRSIAGRAVYRLNRLQKLSNSRADMSRILYRGNYSKRFERFLGLCDRAGFDSIVQGANDLKALIKG